MLSVLLMTATNRFQDRGISLRRAPREGDIEFYEALLPLRGLSEAPSKVKRDGEARGGLVWLLKLIAPVLWLFVPVLLLLVAEFAFAQAGNRALVQDPTGLLAGNAKAKDVAGLAAPRASFEASKPAFASNEGATQAKPLKAPAVAADGATRSSSRGEATAQAK